MEKFTNNERLAIKLYNIIFDARVYSSILPHTIGVLRMLPSAPKELDYLNSKYPTISDCRRMVYVNGYIGLDKKIRPLSKRKKEFVRGFCLAIIGDEII